MKTSIKPELIRKYDNFTIAQLEALAADLVKAQKSHPTQVNTRQLSIVHYTIQQHQRQLKAKAMEFESTNDHYLLFFASTHGYFKLAGRSALFFAAAIADRIHWRYSLKGDTDCYAPSEDGVISFRSLELLRERLANINILLDSNLTTTELYFYQLPKAYTTSQIAKLRNNTHRDFDRIMSTVMPKSPMPLLYDAITQFSQISYNSIKHLSDTIAREDLCRRIIEIGFQMTIEYNRFARAKDADSTINTLLVLIRLSRNAQFLLAFVSGINLIHHRDACKALEHLVTIERISTKAYARKKKPAKLTPASQDFPQS